MISLTRKYNTDCANTMRLNLLFKLLGMMEWDYTMVFPCNDHIVKGGTQMSWAWASSCSRNCLLMCRKDGVCLTISF